MSIRCAGARLASQHRGADEKAHAALRDRPCEEAHGRVVAPASAPAYEWIAERLSRDRFEGSESGRPREPACSSRAWSPLRSCGHRKQIALEGSANCRPLETTPEEERCVSLTCNREESSAAGAILSSGVSKEDRAARLSGSGNRAGVAVLFC